MCFISYVSRHSGVFIYGVMVQLSELFYLRSNWVHRRGEGVYFAGVGIASGCRLRFV